MREEILRMERVTYLEQGTPQLENFSMTLWEGEIFGLIPVNHHGVSSLLKLLRQNLPLHYGYVYYRDQLVNHWRGGNCGINRISIIQNKSCLAEGLTVADNIFVLRPGFKKKLINPKVLEEQLEPFMKDIDMNISGDAYVETLSPFERFVVELLKAVVAGHRLVVLEDIGNFISDRELKKIHGILRHYAAQGISFLYIASHFEEVRRICHRTALMMNGVIIKCFQQTDRVPATFLLDCVEEFERKVKEQIEKKPDLPGQPGAVFQAVDLCLGGEERLSFSVAPGECLVLQDLDNRIFPELIEVLSGKQTPQEGCVYVEGAPLGGRRDRRIAVVQELATQTMLFPNVSYLDNLCFTLDHRFPDVWTRGRIKKSIRREYAGFLGEEVFNLPVEALSERQKYELVYTRILLQNPRVVFCVQPFKGAEVAMRLRVWEFLALLLEREIAVVVLAVNLADSLALADRLIQVRQGRVEAEYDREDFAKLPVDTPWLYLYQQRVMDKKD